MMTPGFSAEETGMALLRRVIGAVLRRVRQHQGRTLRDVAEAAGVSLPYLSEVERGTKEASSEVLAAICRALGLPMPDLLDEVRRELLRDLPTPRATTTPAPRSAMPTASRPTTPTGSRPTTPTGSRPTTPTGSRPAVSTGSRSTMPAGPRSGLPVGPRSVMPAGPRSPMLAGPRSEMPSVPRSVTPVDPTAARSLAAGVDAAGQTPTHLRLRCITERSGETGPGATPTVRYGRGGAPRSASRLRLGCRPTLRAATRSAALTSH
jgi:transcriptional regulator with XRE-family HTH domain